MNESGIDRYYICAQQLTAALSLRTDPLTYTNATEFMNSTVIDYEPLSSMPLRVTPAPLVEIFNDLVASYNFSEYYDLLIAAGIATPNSVIIPVEHLFEQGDRIIATMPNREVFARMDRCSSKPSAPFTTAHEIHKHLSESERTREFLTGENNLVLREYIPDVESAYYEVRCIVHNGKLRGISGPYGIPDKDKKQLQPLRKELTAFVAAVVNATENNDCSIDVLVPKNFLSRFIVIEINTPVWLLATSGLFDLDVLYDREVLFGMFNADVISYPVLKYSDQDGAILTA